MKHRTLHMDLCFNIFMGRYSWFSYQSVSSGIVPSIVNPTLQHAFHNDQWILMPEDWVIERYSESLSFFITTKPSVQRGNFPEFPVCHLIMTWLWVSKLTDLRAGKHFYINLWLLMTWDWSRAEIIPLMTLIPFTFIHTTPCHSWKATWIQNLLFLMLGKSCNDFQVVILKHYISPPHLLAFFLW